MSDLRHLRSDIACPIWDVRSGTYVQDRTSQMGHAMSEVGLPRWDIKVQLYFCPFVDLIKAQNIWSQSLSLVTKQPIKCFQNNSH